MSEPIDEKKKTLCFCRNTPWRCPQKAHRIIYAKLKEELRGKDE